jgi:TolB-like protein/DNA-binding winged helix-turn-helix (wHTH) protein/Flp pilus assembly protein TadD
MGKTAKQSYEFGPFRLIPDERQLLRDGDPVALTPKGFDLLVVLVENAGHLIEKGELLNRVWPDSFVEEGNLTVKMSELRRALGKTAGGAHYVETIPRSGYRFVASVTSSGDEVPEPPAVSVGDAEKGSEQVLPQTEPVPPASHTRRWVYALIGVAVVFILLVGLNAGGLRDRIFPGAAGPTAIRSVAVLPLENLSGDASQDYFAEGMTEALITDLAKIHELRVISRPTVIQYKGTRKPVPEIARELNVDAVLTGSVVRAGARVRIAVQLIHAATDRTLWTDSYERDLRDVLALQRDVARDVVSEIKVTLTPQEQKQFGTASPVDPEAYDHYLRGKFYLHRQTRENNETAIAALESAVTADPAFAAAHAELAQAYVWKLFLFAPEEQQLAEKAFVSAEKALALDPGLAVAYLARGRLLWTPANNFPHEKAIREYKRALELDPNLDEARNQLALVYGHIGALDEALRELEQAIETNPTNSLAQFRIGETHLFQGKFEEALTDLRRVPNEVNPALVCHQIVLALFNLGRREEASATLERFLVDYPEENRGLFTSLQALLAASNGQHETAEEKVKSAVSKGRGFGHFHHTAYHIACAYALMNKPEEAVRWLTVAADEGFPCYPLFENDPNLNNIRNDARFTQLMTNLRRQWEQYKTAL